ncbi:hypothetical protein AB0A76_08955 [Streptomyces exfoliatus]|uniref:Uncharacterized protein n=1 Tax=Streptomyces exfoliatus TaxID=1905 RepID=A0ABV3CSY2_STREX
MKHCAYCKYPIVGEAVEIVPEAASGARPTAYWHKTAGDCVAAEERQTGSASPLRRNLSRL